MTVNLANTADGGTSGTTITPANSGGTSGAAFDAVVSNTGSGGILAYDSTHVLGGHPLSLKIATGASSVTGYTAWTTSLTASSIPQVWFRLYLFLTGNPAAQYGVWRALNGASLCSSVLITALGKLLVVNSAGSTISLSTTTIPLNQWFRLEGFMLASATAGQTELRLYKTADAAPQNYDEIDTSAATQNTSTAITTLRYGLAVAAANVGPYWQASPGASDTAYLGPEAPMSGVPRVLAGPALLNGPMRYARPRLIAPVEPSGRRVLQATLPVTVTTAGTIQDQASKTFPVTVTTAGAAQDQVGKTLTAAVTATAADANSPGKTLAATVTATGALARAAGKALAVTVTTAGAAARNVGKALPATVATSGSLGRTVSRTFAVTVSATASLTRALARTYVATVTTTASLAKNPAKTFAATVTTASSLARSIGKTLRATVSAIASLLLKAPVQPAVITITPGGPLAAQVAITPGIAAALAITPAGPLAAEVAIASGIAAAVTITPGGNAAALVTATSRTGGRGSVVLHP